MRHLFTYLLLCLMLPLSGWAQNLQTVKGTVQDEEGRPLPGVTVLIRGTGTGDATNDQGNFELKVDFAKAPVVLVVSFVGYAAQNIPLAGPASDLVVKMRLSGMLDQVVVSASRVEESIGRVPVTVEKLSTRQVEQITTPDLVAGLARFKSIDVSNSSMLLTSFSTRGFSSSRSDRVIQLSDYADTQLPSLSSNFGNLLGTPILDVASVEVVHGPASALYGANAFNGVLLTNSKDPFKDTGLTVRLRGGNRDLLDGQLRYALKLGERVAFKIAGGYIRARDFTGNNFDATSKLLEPANNAAGSNLGYDAVSVYGDAGNTFGATGGALAGKTVFLPGFSEADLITGKNETYSLKVAPSVSVLLTDHIKATASYRYAASNTTFQAASRYRIVDAGAHQGKLAIEGRNWFVRAFQTRDFSGGRDPLTDGSYNLGFLGGLLQNQPALNAAGQPVLDATGKPVTYAQRYFGTYAAAYNAAFGANGGNADAAALTARTTANTAAPVLQPGTPEFAAARDRIIHNPIPGQGARLILRSILTEGSGQYNFNSEVADVVVGGSYRQYDLGSDGSLLQDTRESGRIRNYEYGAYAQVSKALLDDHLKLAAAGRVDRFQNFGTAFSPRVSAVFSLGAEKQHNFRGSYSRAFRAASQDAQYIRLDVGRAILVGNVGAGFQGYTTGLATQLPGILAPTRTADLAALEYQSPGLKLEKVNSGEVGYRGQLTSKLFVDLDYFYSAYDNFIATRNFIGNLDGSRPTAAQIGAAAPFRFANAALPTRVIQINTNVDQTVKSQGAGISVGYAFGPALTVTGNYSYNELITTDFQPGTLSFFNTPQNKFNLGVDGQLFDRKLSYNANYRYVDSYVFESTFATGTIPTAQVVDAQFGYAVPKLHTTVQVGGTNLFDSTNFQVYGAGSQGRIVYAGLLFDIK
ncbi:TonB-dependent receptor [Hymenobacter sp. UYCo722]|uniref:TonB-dependent receptor n=1 Tax=Hymenobacter sp. UYCo722 TaxID=3156335 RepID=UPI003396D6FE